jgi:hypothetical protein
MLDRVSTYSRLAIEGADRAVARKTDDDKSVGNWFSRLCDGLFESKAGTALYYIAGCINDERSCQRYAAGTVGTSGDFIRALLRSEQGETFLNGIMDGCEAQWWRDHQRALKIGRAAIAADE